MCLTAEGLIKLSTEGIPLGAIFELSTTAVGCPFSYYSSFCAPSRLSIGREQSTQQQYQKLHTRFHTFTYYIDLHTNTDDSGINFPPPAPPLVLGGGSWFILNV